MSTSPRYYKKGRAKPKTVKIVCAKCGKEFDVFESRVKDGAKYCSPRCYWLARTGTKNSVTLDAILEKNPRFRAFIRGLTSKATQRTYAYQAGKALGTDIDSFLTKSPSERKEILTEFIATNNEYKVSKSATKLSITSLKSFLEDSEIDLGSVFWKNLNKKIRSNGMPSEDQAPSSDVVRSLVELIPFRDRVAAVLMCSSGIRVGGLVTLRVKDYKRLAQKIGELRVYSYDPESAYTALCSEEACDLIDRYLDLRRSHGENLTPVSWLFRDIYDPADKRSVETPQQLTVRAIEQKFTRYWNMSGLRNGSENGSRIHQYKTVHGFRKFFKSQLVGDRCPEEITERLLGHSQGLTDNYFVTNVGSAAWDRVIEVYLEHAVSLAIDEKYRRKSEVAQQLATYAVESDQKVKRLEAELASMKRREEENQVVMDWVKRAMYGTQIQGKLEKNQSKEQFVEDNLLSGVREQLRREREKKTSESEETP
jgi:integrase